LIFFVDEGATTDVVDVVDVDVVDAEVFFGTIVILIFCFCFSMVTAETGLELGGNMVESDANEASEARGCRCIIQVVNKLES
jgi:hypothetical protein